MVVAIGYRRTGPRDAQGTRLEESPPKYKKIKRMRSQLERALYQAFRKWLCVNQWVNATFTPLVLTTTGGMGQPFSRDLQRRNEMYLTTTLNWVRCRLSFVINKKSMVAHWCRTKITATLIIPRNAPFHTKRS